MDQERLSRQCVVGVFSTKLPTVLNNDTELLINKFAENMVENTLF